MVEAKVVIQNETGLHARPASQFIAVVNKYKENVRIIKGDKIANAKSILNVLTLGLRKGTEITLQVEGENEQQVLEELVHFIENIEG